MDHIPRVPDAAHRFTWRRLVVTLLVAGAVVAIGSWLVRTYPNPGYEAGYEAVMTQGSDWVRAEADAGGGSPTALCEALFNAVERSPGEPRYDHDTFVAGCTAAVEQRYGGQVPPAPGKTDQNRPSP